jgi:hypothetical protein
MLNACAEDKLTGDLLQSLDRCQFAGLGTEYANEPLVHRSMTRKTARTRIPQGSRVLIWFSELMDKLLRFFHSVFVEGRTDQDFLLAYA